MTEGKSRGSDVKWKCPRCDAADRGAEAFMTCSLIVSLCGECQLNARNVNVKTSLCHRVCVCVCVPLHAEVILHVLFFFFFKYLSLISH